MVRATDETAAEPAPDDAHDALKARYRAASATVTQSLTGRAPTTPTDEARSLAAELEKLAEPDRWDRYGEQGAVAEIEEQVAELLGKPAAALFPSGVMAQQSTLRVWTDRHSSKRIAIPELSHLLQHEMDGPRLLHGFRFELLTRGANVPLAKDLAAISGRLGAALVELPLRDGGYLLPTWNELVEFASACRERGVPLHVDGARIWESQPYLGHSLAEICDLADSAYVSLYKGLGGWTGALVAGPQDVVDEARQWRTRHGGTLFTLMPSAVTGLRGLRERLPEMAAYHEGAVELAARFKADGAKVFPDPPQSNAFRLYLPDEADAIVERLIGVMQREHLALTPPWEAADTPGWSWTEFVVGPATLQRSVDDVVAKVLGELVG